MKLHLVTLLSLVGALGSFAVAATFAGIDGYPRNVLSLYENAAYPRVAINERGVVPFGVRSELNFVSTEANVVIEAESVEASSPEASNIMVSLEGDLAKTDDGRHIDVEMKESSVTIRTRERPLSLLKFPVLLSSSKAPLFTIRLPKAFSGILRVETSSGSVSLKGGSLVEFAVSTKSGGISVASSDARALRLDSHSGAIKIEAMTQDVIAETMSGPIEARVRPAEGTLQGSFVFRSKSGPIDIAVPKESSLAVLIETESGPIESEFDLSRRDEYAPHKVSGDIGDGRGSLFIRTWSSSVSLAPLAP